MLKDSGILVLPNERTLRDYTACFKSSLGLNSSYLDNVKKDFNLRSDPNEYDKWVGIIHDEVSLRQELVFDDAGKLIGFVDLGSVQNAIDELEVTLSSKENSIVPPRKQLTCLFSWLLAFFQISKCLSVIFPQPPSNHLHCLMYFGNVLKN